MTGRPRPLRSMTSPSRTTVSPDAASSSITSSEVFAATTATMPMPQLKVLSISDCAMLP